jgi:DNA-binding LytR/AlgR family response regulator
MIHAIALDDELPGLSVIETFCKQVDFVQLDKTFQQPTEALKYLDQFPVDLIFLDIQMPSLTGIDFYRQVKQNIMVIFTTAYSEYAVEGFNLQAVDYLLKPFTFERFLIAVKKAHEYHTFQQSKGESALPYLLVRADYSLVKINLSDITFIEGLDDYLKINLHQQKTVIARMTMKAMIEKLPSRDFVRVHRSYIVPVKRITNVRNKLITIGTHEIPIGASYEEEFLKRFKG